MTTDQLSGILTSGKATILVGAGISFQAGIPLVSDIVPAILRAIGASEEDTRRYVDIGLPFESTMQAIANVVGLDGLLPLFEGESPGRNHALIARLVKASRLPAVITTNFDQMIERAIEECEGTFQLLLENDQIEPWTGNGSSRLLKMHGCLSRPHTLGATINAVASQRAIRDRQQSLSQIFGNGEIEHLIVIGYSFSDRFDVSPAFEGLKLPIRVTLIEHSPADSGEVREFSDLPDGHPLRAYQGKVIWRNVDNLVEEVWRITQSDQPPPASYRPTKLAEKVDEWRKEFSHRMGAGFDSLLAAALFKGANLYDTSNVYGFRSLAIVDGSSASLRMMTHQIIGDNLRDTGAGRRALAHLRSALRYATKEEAIGSKAKAINSIGIVLEDRAKKLDAARELDAPRLSRRIAIRCYEIARDWANEAGDFDQASKCEGNIGIALKNINDAGSRRKSFRHLKTALRYAQETGDPKAVARYYGMLASCVGLSGKKGIAGNLWEKALKVSKDIQDHRHIAIWTANAGEDLIGIDNDAARARLQEAAGIFGSLKCFREVEHCQKLLKAIAN